MFDALMAGLAAHADMVADVPVLQPADPFLDTVGEDMRSRIFMTETSGGEALCLRPEFTIPVCLHHIGQTADPKRYVCGGTVFRQTREGNREFLQIGIEYLGGPDTAQTDATCFSTFQATLAKAGIHSPRVTLGDQALFDRVVIGLDLPDFASSRLRRAFGDGDLLNRLVAEMAASKPEAASESKQERWALDGDRDALVTHVQGIMEESGLAPGAGRSPEQIADRMIARTRERHWVMPEGVAETLSHYLAIEAPLSETADLLRAFQSENSIDFGDALVRFDETAKIIFQSGPNEQLTWQAAFGRKLDYYTGMLFSAHSGDRELGGGGRYNRLCTLLGASKPVAAIGFSIALDRVVEVTT